MRCGSTSPRQPWLPGLKSFWLSAAACREHPEIAGRRRKCLQGSQFPLAAAPARRQAETNTSGAQAIRFGTRCGFQRVSRSWHAGIFLVPARETGRTAAQTIDGRFEKKTPRYIYFLCARFWLDFLRPSMVDHAGTKNSRNRNHGIWQCVSPHAGITGPATIDVRPSE